MKTVLAFMALFTMQQAFAQNVTELRNGDIGLSKASGEIVSVREICPQVPGRFSCMAHGSVIEVKVNLNGCLDRLGGHYTKFEVIDGKGILYFGAINISTKASRTARCIQQAFEKVSVNVPFEGEIELVELDYTGSTI